MFARAKSPNAYKGLLKASLVFLCWLACSSLSLAEEKLPAIVKKIEPSTLVVLTYDKEGKLLGQGSGFFAGSKGRVITSRHVLLGASRAEIKTAHGKTYPITHVVMEDVEADILGVSVDIPLNRVHSLALSGALPETGQRVIVVGSPLGLERTVSDGIVSAVREIPTFGKIIQITAPLSPGSSGSPVLNARGQVIGVVTLQMLQGQNLNFAIPAERVRKSTWQKQETLAQWHGRTTEPWPESAEGLYAAGLGFLWAEDYEKGLSYFEEAVEKNPVYPEAYFQIGYCLGQLGRISEAIEAYKEAIRIKPDDAEAHYNLGLTYGEVGRTSEEINAYKDAIRINRDYAEAHNNLGVVYGKLGHIPEAIEACKEAIRINPDYAEAHYNLGLAYGELGHIPEAIEACKEAIRIKPDYAQAHGNLGVAYAKLGRTSQAVEAFKEAIRIKADDAELHYNLGVVYRKLGRSSEAIQALKEAIRINPDLAEAHNNLGIAYGKLGRTSEQIQAYKEAIRIKPHDAEVHYNLGVAYAKLGRTSQAVEALEEAIRINPDDADAHFNLGLCYLILGDRHSALEEYKILKEVDKELANRLFKVICD